MAKVKYSYIPPKHENWWLERNKAGITRLLSVLQTINGHFTLLHK